MMQDALIELAEQVGGAVREALGSWSRTGRLCCLLVATGVAIGMYSLLKGS